MEEKFKYMDSFNSGRFKENENKNYLSLEELKVHNVYNGIILPVKKEQNDNLFGNGGVITKEYDYVESSAQLGQGMKKRVYGKYDVEEEINYIDEKVMYLNFFIHQWGHFLIDVISRLWYVLEHKDEKIKIVYTCRYGEIDYMKGNYLEFIKLLGIDEKNLIMINKPTQFKEVIVPDNSLYPGKYYTKEYRNIFREIINNVKREKEIPHKIYLSRSLLKNKFKKEIGEQEIEKFFNDNGYISIYPERLTLKEQIQYFKYANKIVLTSGSLAHNVLFCNNNEVIILNKTYSVNLHQSILNQVFNTNIKYIDIHISMFPILYGYGPFLLEINNNLKQFAKDNNYNLRISKYYIIKKFIKKIWYCVTYFIIYIMFKKKVDKNEVDYRKLWQFYKNR